MNPPTVIEPRSFPTLLLVIAGLLTVLVPGCVAPTPTAGQARTPVVLTNGVPVTNHVRAPKTSVKPVTLAPAVPTRNAVPPRYPLITPLDTVFGRVVSVNPQARFVVVDFSFNGLPAADQRLGVFRQGQRVGEVRVSIWAKGGRMAADLLDGEARVGDEVRAE